jgi:hypothetical protein
MKKKMFVNRAILTIVVVLAVLGLVSGCDALMGNDNGMSKDARLSAFIADMESGDSPNPRGHFSGNANASKIDSSTFNSTNMAPNDNLDITGYVISGDTFTMDYTTEAFPSETIATASFYMEKGALGEETWYIKSMTVPFVASTKLIPDDL